MSAIPHSADDLAAATLADDAALLDAALRLGRQIVGGVAHDLNSAMQGLGDALFVIGEEVNGVLDGIPDDAGLVADMATRIRESLQLADSAFHRLTSAGRGVSDLIPAMDEESEPIDLRTELDELVSLTAHQWRHRLDVSVVVDPAMPTFTCTWWIARLAAARLFQIAAESHPNRRGGSDRSLPRFRMIASESEGFVVLRVLCDQPSTDIAPPTPIAPRHGDPTLRLCASRLSGEVSSVPCSLGSFGLAFRFPVHLALGFEEAVSR
ncbi:MAG TPA: hypothetical protein VHV78_04695 [Gemmatimonadaceae bacterium]|nr:hypothetical protein [Gemmatimonadaceae bacterium]